MNISGKPEFFELEGEQFSSEDHKITSKDDKNFLEKYIKTVKMIEQEQEVLTSQYKKRMKALDARRRAVEYFNKERADAVFLQMYRERKTKKVKYIDFEYGRMSIRDSKGYVAYRGEAKDLKRIFGEEIREFITTVEKVETNLLKKSMVINDDGMLTIRAESGELLEIPVSDLELFEIVPDSTTISLK